MNDEQHHRKEAGGSGDGAGQGSLCRCVRRTGEVGAFGACADAFGELAKLVRSESPLVRRLAASALGKLSGLVASEAAVRALHPLLQDRHPQVRQYSAKALGAFGAAAKDALPDLRDLYKSPVEKDYVKRSVATAGKQIRTAVEIAERSVVRGNRRMSNRECRISKFPSGGFSLRDSTFLVQYSIFTGDQTRLGRDTLYQQQGKKLVSLYPKDKPRMRDLLLEKLENLK